MLTMEGGNFSSASLLMTEESSSLHPAYGGAIVDSVSNDLVAGLPLFFATAVHAFEGIGVVLPLVKEMERPELFPGFNGVLNTSMMLVGLLYMAMGYFGYLKYGQFINGSITLNLPKTTLNEFVRLMFAMAIGLSYGLQFYVPWSIMWPYIDERLFYAYRPREARDKLDLVGKIKEINLTESMAQATKLNNSSSSSSGTSKQQHQSGQQPHPQSQQQVGGNKSRHQVVNKMRQDANGSQLLSNSTTGDTSGRGSDLLTSYWRKRPLDNNLQNSFGATMATSYTMSTNYTAAMLDKQQQQQTLPTVSKQVSSAAPLASYFGSTNYRSFDLPAGQTVGQRQTHQLDHHQDQGEGNNNKVGHKVARNRFEDVVGNESTSSTRSLPDVKWRPPPRSMRGKRKLVRYTVILLFVALTCK